MCPLVRMSLLVEPAGRPAPSVRQSGGGPDLAARCAAPIRGGVHFFAGGLDVNRAAEGAGLGRDDDLIGLGIHKARLSALGIVSLSQPLFGYPLMTDAPQINLLIAPAP